MLDKSTFLNKYNIPEDELERLNIDWKVLIEIYEDYLNRKDNFEIQAEAVANILRSQSKVHTVRSRVKDPEHLIEKLIRKTEQRRKSKADGAFQFNKENYRNEITDLKSKNEEIARMKCEIENLRKQIEGLEIEDDKKESIQSAINNVEKSVTSTNELYSEIIVPPPHLNAILAVTEDLNPLRNVDTSNIVAISNNPATASIKAVTDSLEKALGKPFK